MAHSLIIGMTESGKTTLAKKLCEKYRASNIKTIVLDPLWDNWNADFQTDNPSEFMAVVSNPETQSCAVFIDESGESIGQYNKEMFWLATRARHYGHNSHFIVQRTKQLSPTVRGQCRFLYLFNSPINDCKELAQDFNEPRLITGADLEQGHCYFVQRMRKEQFRELNVFI
jgi:hypothetical protein